MLFLISITLMSFFYPTKGLELSGKILVVVCISRLIILGYKLFLTKYLNAAHS